MITPPISPMVLNGTNCPFCHGERLIAFSTTAHDDPSKTVNTLECIACEAGWQWPLQRTALQSEQIFEEAYTSGKQDSYFDVERRNAVASVQCNFVQKQLAKVGSILDIGCGDGTFARQMAVAGWNVVGLDPAIHTPTSENYVTGSLRMTADFVTELSRDETFDLITLWDVIEHVEDPQGLVVGATSHLNIGGMLIIETGNYQCQARLEGLGDWWNYQIDHRWYFAPPQVRNLLKNAGLAEIALADQVLRPWWKGQSEIQLPSLMSSLKAAIRSPRNFPKYWHTQRQNAEAAKRWKGWGGLEILTMTGIRPG